MPLQSTHHRYSFEVNNEDEFWAKISTAKNRAQQGEYITLDEFNSTCEGRNLCATKY